MVGFSCGQFYFRVKTDGRQVAKSSDGNTWIVHEAGLTLTSGQILEEPAFIDGDCQL
jgi:hypothetical protein